MKPLNSQARSNAIFKFIIFVTCSLLLVTVAVFLFFRVPKSYVVDRIEPKDNSPEWMPSLKSKIDQAIVNQQRVNYLFVLDATPGMENYLPVISKAIETFPSMFPDSAITTKFSAAYYRDASEGDFLFDNSGRRTSAEMVSSWVGRIIPQVKDDTDAPEAVFYGLKEALSADFFEKGSTNVVVLVGDAGNHSQAELTDISGTEIGKLLKIYTPKFYAIQVQHPSADEAFNQFIPQVRDEILQPVLSQIQSDIQSLTKSEESIAWGQQGDEFGNHYFIQQGNLKTVDLYELEEDNQLPPDLLMQQINSIFKQIETAVHQNITELKAIKEQETIGAEQDKTLSASLLKQNEVPDDQILYLLKANASSAIR